MKKYFSLIYFELTLWIFLVLLIGLICLSIPYADRVFALVSSTTMLVYVIAIIFALIKWRKGKGVAILKGLVLLTGAITVSAVLNYILGWPAPEEHTHLSASYYIIFPSLVIGSVYIFMKEKEYISGIYPVLKPFFYRFSFYLLVTTILYLVFEH